MVSAAEKNVIKCLEAQVEEVEVLCSIFGTDWKTENEADRSYSMEIKEGHIVMMFYVTLPETYPYNSPPTFTISAPGLKAEYKRHLTNLLQEVYLQNIGQTVLFQWIDKIKEYLGSLVLNLDSLVDDEAKAVQLECETLAHEIQIPEIVHGERIIDRKSTFQGHVAQVISVNEVRSVLNELNKNKKIANATHKIFAYRINNPGKTLIQDCDDDGETNSGGRLLHLLQVLNLNDILVVVSRWYGGVHLGSARFAHIKNAAKQALEQAGLISSSKKRS